MADEAAFGFVACKFTAEKMEGLEGGYAFNNFGGGEGNAT